MAHDKGSTGHFNDVLDMGKMVASLQKVPATAFHMHTSEGDQRHKGDVDIQSLELKHGGSGGIGGVG